MRVLNSEVMNVVVGTRMHPAVTYTFSVAISSGIATEKL
jgi:hypothetical protein